MPYTDEPTDEAHRSLIETLAVTEKRLSWALDSLDELDRGMAGGPPATNTMSVSKGSVPAQPTLVNLAERNCGMAGRLADRIATLRSMVLGPEVALASRG